MIEETTSKITEKIIPPPSLPRRLEVTIKKSKIDSFFSLLWAAVKIFFLLFLLITVFSGSEESPATPFVPIDFYFRDTEADASAKKVALLSLSGDIVSRAKNTSFGENSVIEIERTISTLRSIQENKDIEALLLRIDSRGGEVLASARIAEMVDTIAAEKPIFVLFESYGASGAYYIATSAQKIYAFPDSLVGNIGVRFDLPDLQQLMEKVGVSMQSVTSGDLKNMGTPFRSMNAEERAIFQELVQESYDTFVARVSEGRRIPLKKTKLLADGRIYSGRQAAKNGLIDATVLSFAEMAKDIEKEMGGKIQLLDYREPVSPLEQFFLSASARIPFLQSRFPAEISSGRYLAR